jgi:hypothetical protein
MQEKIDTFGVQLPQEIQQVRQRAAETIDRPSRHHVHFTARHRLEQCV